MIRSSLFLALVAVATLAGCSGSDTSTISRSDVEAEVVTQLTDTVGQAPDDVTCPGDLEAEVGATATCVLTSGGETIDVAVEVTEADGGEYTISIQVADAPN